MTYAAWNRVATIAAIVGVVFGIVLILSLVLRAVS